MWNLLTNNGIYECNSYLAFKVCLGSRKDFSLLEIPFFSFPLKKKKRKKKAKKGSRVSFFIPVCLLLALIMQTSHPGQGEFWLIYRLQEVESWCRFSDCLCSTERHRGGKKWISNPGTSSIISALPKFARLRESGRNKLVAVCLGCWTLPVLIGLDSAQKSS